ncbi:hypothetical protein L7F22_034942 [Adiantum nelumboides]|nr:hypothetical protein [Adiantum nelumboides]
MTYAICLKGCGNVKGIESTQNLYSEIIKKGYDRDPFISNGVLDVYGKQGFLYEARKIFDILLIQDIFSWNALISGYAQHGLSHEVVLSYNQMHAKGVLANALTFVLSMKACCAIQDIQKGQELHIKIVKRGMEKDDCIETSVMDLYIKFEAFEVGVQIFNEQEVHDAVSWTSLLSGYAEQGHGAEALECLMQMQQAGVSPTALTLAFCLRTCTSSQDFTTGCCLHDEVIKRGFVTDQFVVPCVIDVYIKSGALEEAQLIFEKIVVHDEHAWTVSVEAYEKQGCFEQLSRCLKLMELDGVFLVVVH